MQKQQTLLSAKHKHNIVLKCLADAADPLIIEWFRNAKKLDVPTPNSNYMIDERNRKLIILNPSKLNNGVYQCSAQNAVGIVFSQNNYVIDIDLRKSDKKTKASNNYRCSYKDALDISGDMKNGLSNDADESVEIMKSVRHDNRGVYLCRGKRGERVQQDAVLSTVANDLPTIADNLAKPHTIKVLVNDNDGAILNCDIGKGNRKNVFVVKWRKDDKPFRNVDINSPTSSPPDVSTDSAIPREDCKYIY